ncbi:MAG: prepilin peptidase [Patescibacteria group bacterium]
MLAIFFILGLIIGSFLNVVIYRLKTAESLVFGGSKCPHCSSAIRWYDNIPLFSFLILRFRCRDCQEKISWQYPLVELGTAFIFVILGSQFFILNSPESWFITLYYWILASLSIVIFAYDFRYMEIPMSLVWIGSLVAFLFRIYSDYLAGAGWRNIFETGTFLALLSAGLAFLFFFALSYGSKEKWMGMGDAYLAIFLGLALGGISLLYALSIGFSLGALVGIALIILRKKNLGSQLPLAPFLIVGTWIMLLWGEKFNNWYMSLFF